MAWDGSTSGVGRLLFAGSDTGSAQTIYLAPAMLVSTQPAWPGHIPVGNPGATAPVLDVSALTEHVNREGELAVDLPRHRRPIVEVQITRLSADTLAAFEPEEETVR